MVELGGELGVVVVEVWAVEEGVVAGSIVGGGVVWLASGDS